jgi:hypothetical protein
MPEPVSEQILSTIRTRLLEYTTDTQRSTRVSTWQPKDGTLVVNMMSLERNEELSCPGNPPAQAWDMTVEICGLIKPSDSDTTAVDTHKGRVYSEIVKACCDGISGWWKWGEKSINSTFGGVEEHTDDNGAFAGVKVTMTTTFRTDEDNPFNVRA